MDIAAHSNTTPIARKTQIERAEKERGRLLNYIKKQVSNVADAEDIVQDVMSEFAERHFLLSPIEQVTGWLYTVARNRITDLFRKKKNVAQSDFEANKEETDLSWFNEILIEAETPESELYRQVVLEELAKALEQLPEKQRRAFVEHELNDVSFKDLAAMSGETVNTWISRKRYAVLFLREKLQHIYLEFIND